MAPTPRPRKKQAPRRPRAARSHRRKARPLPKPRAATKVPLRRRVAVPSTAAASSRPQAASPAVEIGPDDPMTQDVRWQAYESMAHRLETATGVRLETMHGKLDEEGMRGQSFSFTLLKVGELFDVPSQLAGVVVRSYPGYEGGPGDADIRAWAHERRNRKFPVPKGWQPWLD